MGYFIARTPHGFCFRKVVSGQNYAKTVEFFESKGYTAGPWIPGKPHFTVQLTNPMVV
jgi:hypothetical protein